MTIETRNARSGLPDLPDLTDSGGSVVGDGVWLALHEVVERFRTAGYPDGESAIRRMIDDGALGESFKTGGGHRRVKAAAVDVYLAHRAGPPD